MVLFTLSKCEGKGKHTDLDIQVITSPHDHFVLCAAIEFTTQVYCHLSYC